ncbi:MAG: STAS domain-containing protein [Prevotella sp.]|jgi:anti-sigma B factor antagonist|nr:STAS domain-containing protein [Prevotella sp.]
MEIKITEKNDRLVALLIGELDNTACIEAKKALAPLTQQNDHDVEIDCSELEYISSSGLRLFIGIYKHQHEIGRRSIMSHVSDKLKDVFEIGGFLMLFEQEG